MNAKPKIISLVGLTASGKSALGVELARLFNGEIISCDSRQIYRGLDIGTAKIAPAEMRGVPHHLIDIIDPGEHFDVYEFQQLAYKTIADILSRGKLPILVGGTGLYSRSVTEGYCFNAKSKMQNAKSGENAPLYDVLQICLMPPKEHIAELVTQRIAKRLADGMIAETERLLAAGVDRNWLSRLGLEYFWNTELLAGRVTLAEYKRNLATKTMQYAKRQRTWFRREKNTIFLTDPATFLKDCKNLVTKFI